jgi:translation initiation factor IF-2
VTGDVDGSLEAILSILSTYGADQCQLDILHYGVGPVTESDIEMAATFEGKFLYNTMQY